jgi:ribosomal protein S24E
MKLTIKNKVENSILRRAEIEAELVFTGPTPSKETVKNEIASQTKANADVVEVKEIITNFGQQFGKAIVYVYSDAASKREMIKLNKKQVEKEKKAKEEAKKKAEAAAK